jgi:hypothetical protein
METLCELQPDQLSGPAACTGRLGFLSCCEGEAAAYLGGRGGGALGQGDAGET